MPTFLRSSGHHSSYGRTYCHICTASLMASSRPTAHCCYSWNPVASQRPSLPVTKTWSWLQQTDSNAYVPEVLGAPLVVWPNLLPHLHCFADGVIEADCTLLLLVESCCFSETIATRDKDMELAPAD
ncbi:uncharacterized protein LOC119396572 isoform X2 [Rhipicephalus sanguineus]|uniref:uncharacterized protein LOC119396572 isoform X2 n=1 Tax=Rhipicephalus sanguineus TaxID=34632 RepID=UPI0020C25468|nr:uncharacterized protein LOC119396572 isoform X2 [Rhipicephalus sanguineus]